MNPSLFEFLKRKKSCFLFGRKKIRFNISCLCVDENQLLNVTFNLNQHQQLVTLNKVGSMRDPGESDL